MSINLEVFYVTKSSTPMGQVNARKQNEPEFELRISATGTVVLPTSPTDEGQTLNRPSPPARNNPVRASIVVPLSLSLSLSLSLARVTRAYVRMTVGNRARYIRHTENIVNIINQRWATHICRNSGSKRWLVRWSQIPSVLVERREFHNLPFFPRSKPHCKRSRTNGAPFSSFPSFFFLFFFSSFAPSW